MEQLYKHQRKMLSRKHDARKTYKTKYKNKHNLTVNIRKNGTRMKQRRKSHPLTI